MDRAAIVAKLLEIRESGGVQGAPDLLAFFTNLEGMTSARLGASVISALTWIEGKPEHIAVGTQLSMVAMNLKNLK